MTDLALKLAPDEEKISEYAAHEYLHTLTAKRIILQKKTSGITLEKSLLIDKTTAITVEYGRSYNYLASGIVLTLLGITGFIFLDSLSNLLPLMSDGVIPGFVSGVLILAAICCSILFILGYTNITISCVGNELKITRFKLDHKLIAFSEDFVRVLCTKMQ